MSTWTELEESSLKQLEELAPSTERVATCAYGPSVYTKPKSYRGYDILVICEEYASGLRAHRRIINRNEVRFLVTARDLVESDIRKGTLGDFLTEIFIYPYRPITNHPYLESLGLEAKTRVVREEARDLVTEYGEMCRGLVAKPEFFGLSRLRKRARVFLPSMDQYLRLLRPQVREANLSSLRNSFKKAILTIQGDIVEMESESVTIPDATIHLLKQRTRHLPQYGSPRTGVVQSVETRIGSRTRRDGARGSKESTLPSHNRRTSVAE
jgi:hypothetical protein